MRVYVFTLSCFLAKFVIVNKEGGRSKKKTKMPLAFT